MSAIIAAGPAPATYRNETPYPFCPGCGHGAILDALNAALVEMAIDFRRLVIVSDIGCSGLADQYFITNAFHGLHGRSLTYATGIKLARPDLEVVVVMGDGGAGIGGAHLLGAARRNVGLTLLVFNNLNFGMTGGQHSVTTPAGMLSSTTPAGNLERSLDLCALAVTAGAAYAWRGTSFDAELPRRIAEAIRVPGFALLDVWEPCTAHFTARNRIGKRGLDELLKRLGFATGVVGHREVEEYGTAYRAAHADDEPGDLSAGWEPRFSSVLDRPRRLVIAGSAGGRVRSAARILARAAVLAGLRTTVRDDYPVTVKSGHSVSELVLAPEPIHYTGIERPDALLLLSENGRKKALRFLPQMSRNDRIFVLPALAGLATRARCTVLDPAAAGSRIGAGQTALAAAAAMIAKLGIVPFAALEEAVRDGGERRRAANLAALEAGRRMAFRPDSERR